jgi:hypothetical protein
MSRDSNRADLAGTFGDRRNPVAVVRWEKKVEEVSLMGNTPRWPRSARSIAQAAIVIGAVGLVWLALTITGIVDIPACQGSGRGTCGFVVSALAIAALLIFGGATLGTWLVVVTGRTVGRFDQVRRYGRWLSLRERKNASRDAHDLSIEVEYHDGSGGSLAGIEIACVVVGTDATAHRLGNATAVTDELGRAAVDVHVPQTPTMVTVRASVPSNPGIKSAGGVFLVGAP